MNNKLHFLISAIFIVIILGALPAYSAVKTNPGFTKEEQAFIHATQDSTPIKMGIIPNLLPLSNTPPESSEFTGINVAMLDLVTKKSGLTFKYVRIPLEEGSPYDFLKTGAVSLVAGTTRLERFTADPNLILSDRLSDGASVYIAKKGFSPQHKKSGKIAITHGFQAGSDIVAREFSGYKVEFYSKTSDLFHAVRAGLVDMAITNRYTGMYGLQKPINSDLTAFTSLTSMLDSCVMGLRSPETEMAISIINKTFAIITPAEYNHVQMNYTLSNPYKLTMVDLIYKYRFMILGGLFTFVGLSYLSSRLINSKKEQRLLSIDALTGAYSEAGFHLQAKAFIAKSTKPVFIVDFDVLNFQGYNELHGRSEGDALLRNIVNIVKTSISDNDIICRVYSDDFRVLCNKPNIDELINAIKATDALIKEKAKSVIMLSYGIYCVTETALPIASMLDFAKQAKKSAKYTSDKNIGIFDTALHQRSLRETELFSLFQSAIDSNEFVAYYQPKFDAITTKIASAEALVRWRQKDGTILPPAHFIDLFEKNGQIRRLDFYMLNQVCMLQKSLLDKNITPVPIAVNFSRVHLYSDSLVSWINDVVDKHLLPHHLIELEWTETAIMNDNSQAEKILKELQKNGYTVTMDDFGSAYSSLNTLCNMPLDVIKLDREFMLNTLSDIVTKRDKALKVIQGIISLARSLELKVVAEGVETQEQYLFLKEAGCDFIQGYYFSKPLETEKFVEILKDKKKR